MNKNIVVCILLSIVTCGIYGIYWFWCITETARTREPGRVAGDRRDGDPVLHYHLRDLRDLLELQDGQGVHRHQRRGGQQRSVPDPEPVRLFHCELLPDPERHQQRVPRWRVSRSRILSRPVQGGFFSSRLVFRGESCYNMRAY